MVLFIELPKSYKLYAPRTSNTETWSGSWNKIPDTNNYMSSLDPARLVWGEFNLL